MEKSENGKMNYLFDISRKRAVAAAGFMTYASPVPHPTRIMKEHDLIYITEGEWAIRLRDEVLRGKKDDVVILPAYIPHYAAEDCAAGTRTIFLHAALSEGDSEKSRAPAAAGGMEKGAESGAANREESGDGGTYSVALTCHGSAANRPEIKELFRRTAKAKLCGDERTAACCFDLLIDALSGLGSRNAESDLADRIKEMIVDAESEPPQNAEIARRLGVSVRTAETAFRAATGTTIHAYLNARRMERARYYLEFHPEMKIADVACALGFYDAYHFSRSFRAAFGLSPTSFRTEKFVRH